MIDCFNCGAWDDDLIINKQGTIEALQALGAFVNGVTGGGYLK